MRLLSSSTPRLIRAYLQLTQATKYSSTQPFGKTPTIFVHTLAKEKYALLVMHSLSTGSRQPPLIRSKLRLYSMRFCPFAQRAHLVLAAKDIRHDVVYINLADKPQWYNDKAGGEQYAKVPILELEDGTILGESLIIAEYLDEAFSGRQLRASDPLQRAQDKLLVEKFSTVIGAMYEVMYGKGGEKAEETIAKGLELFDGELAKRGAKYLGGSDAPGWLDYMVWPW